MRCFVFWVLWMTAIFHFPDVPDWFLWIFGGFVTGFFGSTVLYERFRLPGEINSFKGEINNLNSKADLLETECRQLKEKLSNTDTLVDDKGGKYLDVLNEMNSLDLRILGEFYKTYDKEKLDLLEFHTLPEKMNGNEFIAQIFKTQHLQESSIEENKIEAGLETLIKLKLLKDESRKLKPHQQRHLRGDGSQARGISYKFKNFNDKGTFYERNIDITATGREIAKISLSDANPPSDTFSQTSAS